MSISRNPAPTVAAVPPPRRERTASVRGQTLIDTVLAIAILSLLVIAIFMLVEKSLETATILEQQHTLMQQRLGFVDLLRTTFRTLPNDALMISRRVTDPTSGAQQQLVFANAPDVLAWGSTDEMLHSSVVLGTQPQLGGGIGLGLQKIVPPDATLSGVTGQTGAANPDHNPNYYLSQIPAAYSPEDTAKWLILLENIKTVQWRFFDPRSVNWLDDWADPGSRPQLVELTIQYLDEQAPQRYVFWMPFVTPNALPKFGGARGQPVPTGQP